MPRRQHTRAGGHFGRALLAAAALGLPMVATALAVPAASAATLSPTAASWCTDHGSTVGGWTDTSPSLPICGPGPAYGGTWSYVDVPGPYGSLEAYFNATPGFQCVELAERYLSVVDGLSPVKANGAQVAENYHAANPLTTRLVVNGTKFAVGRAPAPGDVISLATSPQFFGDGHVAVVVASHVNGLGDGTVTIAQQNVSSGDYHYTLGVSSWRVYDPAEPQDALFQYPYAEWLTVPPARSPLAGSRSIGLVHPVNALMTLEPRLLAARKG